MSDAKRRRMRSVAWWDRAGSTLPEGVDTDQDYGALAWRLAKNLHENQARDRKARANDALTLYFGNQSNGLGSYANELAELIAGVEPPGYNVVQACVDTKTAHTVRNKVRVMMLTDRGDSELQARAKGLQALVESYFHEAGLYGDTAVRLCFDGNLFDGACYKTTPDYQNMRVDGARIFPWEVCVSRRDAKSGKPRQMFYTTSYDRAKLLSSVDPANTELVEAIRNAPHVEADYDDSLDDDEVADEIMVAELWHLPSGRVDQNDDKSFGYNEDGEFDPALDPGHDGRHMIVLEGGAVVLDEPWAFDYFPIHIFAPQPKPVGIWSRGIPETLAGAQLALNRMNTRVDQILHMHARPLLYVWRRAKMNTSKITNDLVSILEGDVAPGQALQYITPQSVPSEYLNRIDKIISWCEKQAGLSELSIAAQKPAGINHAPGLQHLADSEDVRHTPSYRAWEQFHVSIARGVVDCARLLAKHAKRSGQDFEVVLGGDKDLRRFDFSKLNLEPDRCRMKSWPTNLLPQTPGAKASRVSEYKAAGLFDGSQESKLALRLLEFPDLQQAMGDSTAAQDNIERKLDDIQAKGFSADNAPHPYLDIAMAMQLCADRINRLEADGDDSQAIDGLIEFHEYCRALKLRETAEATAATTPGAPMPPGPPGAPPGPPMTPAPPGAPMPPPAM